VPWICHHLLGFCELWFAKFNSDPAASSATADGDPAPSSATAEDAAAPIERFGR